MTASAERRLIFERERLDQQRFLDAIRLSKSRGAFPHNLFSKNANELYAQSVYRNNYQGALESSLKQSFPVTARHIPKRKFNQLIVEFLSLQAADVHRPLEQWPEGFADFVQSKINSSSISASWPSYIPDLLRLEWAVDLATRGAIQADQRLSLERLQLLNSNGDLANRYFFFNSTFQILGLPAGLLELWRALKQHQGVLNQSQWRMSLPCLLKELSAELDVDGSGSSNEVRVNKELHYYSVQIAVNNMESSSSMERYSLSIEPLHPLLYELLNALPEMFTLETLSSLCEDIVASKEGNLDCEEFLASALAQTCEHKYLCIKASI